MDQADEFRMRFKSGAYLPRQPGNRPAASKRPTKAAAGHDYSAFRGNGEFIRTSRVRLKPETGQPAKPHHHRAAHGHVSSPAGHPVNVKNSVKPTPTQPADNIVSRPPEALLQALHAQKAQAQRPEPENPPQPVYEAETLWPESDEEIATIKPRRRVWRRAAIALPVVALLAGGGYLGFGWYAKRGGNDQPATLAATSDATDYLSPSDQVIKEAVAARQSAVNFRLYFPKGLSPEEYKVDAASMDVSDEVFSFVIQRRNIFILVTEKAMSPNYQFPSNVLGNGVESFEPRSFSTRTGPGRIIVQNGRMMGYLAGLETEISFDLTGVSTDEAQLIMQTFTQL